MWGGRTEHLTLKSNKEPTLCQYCHAYFGRNRTRVEREKIFKKKMLQNLILAKVSLAQWYRHVIALKTCYLAPLNSWLSLNFICLFHVLGTCEVELGIRAKLEPKWTKTESNCINREEGSKMTEMSLKSWCSGATQALPQHFFPEKKIFGERPYPGTTTL